MMPNDDIHFAAAWLLGLWLLIPPLAIYTWRRQRLRGGAVLSSLRPLIGVRPGWRVRWRVVLLGLRAVALALLVVALARPQTVESDARAETQGIDIVLAFDVSGSMSQPGLGWPSRLEGAQQALTAFIDGRENDRIGLVIFRSEQKTLAPLTLDYRALSQIIADVNQHAEGLEDGTAIGLGIADGISLLRNSRSRSRIIILATDGENNEPAVPPEQAAAIAATLNIRLYTIGIVGTEERSGVGVDEGRLRDISARTGGAYARATDAQRLREIYDTVADLEKTRFERERLLQYNELAPYLIVAGLGLLLLEAMLGATLFRTAP